MFLSATVEDTFSSRLDTSRTWAFPIAFDLDRNALVDEALMKSKEADEALDGRHTFRRRQRSQLVVVRSKLKREGERERDRGGEEDLRYPNTLTQRRLLHDAGLGRIKPAKIS